MYPNYFGLKEASFSIAPDPQYLFLSDQHKEALAHLLFGAGESGGFVLLTGEVGTGKTTVCRAFLEQLPDGVEVALIINPALTAAELLRGICDEFRIELSIGDRSPKALVDRLNRYLLDAHAQGRRPVLIIDEAQSLRPNVMEQIRLLTNLETTKHKLLQIFLIGQPELRRMLEAEGLRQINQRITARYHLLPLTLAETGEYIRHRVAVAGVDRPLFTRGAIRLVHRKSGGIPRLINIICDRCLLGACVTRRPQVTPAIVRTSAAEVLGAPLAARRSGSRAPLMAAIVFGVAMIGGWASYGWLHWGETLLGLYPGLSELASAPTRPVPQVPEDPPATATDPAAGAEAPPSGPVLPELAESAVASGPASAPGPAGDQTRDPVGDPVDDPAGDLAVAPIAPDRALGPAESPGPGETAPLIGLVRLDGAAATDAIASLSMSEPEGIRALLGRWGVDVEELGAGDPCGRVAGFGLRCEREQGKLSNVRYFDRPALLRLTGDAGPDRVVLLVELGETQATLAGGVGSETASQRVETAALEALWSGDYTLIWQPPPLGGAVIGPGSSGEGVRWLRRLVSEATGAPVGSGDPPRFDAALERAVREFQASRGLAPDGIAGPRTLIQLHNVVAMPGIPRLVPPVVTDDDLVDAQ